MDMNKQFEAMIDTVFQGQASGSVAQRLLASNGNVAALRPWIGEDGRAYITQNQGNKDVARLAANATLRKDEWKEFDQAVLRAARERLIGTTDLTSRGLGYRVGNGLGKTVLEYEDMSDMEDAHISMAGETRGENDRPEFDLNYLPLPIIHKPFQINIRNLNASREVGQSLDTTMAEQAARKVAEKIEEILFTGASAFTYGGGTIRGYTDHPNRNTVSLTGNWDESAQSGEDILADVLSMKQAAIDDRHYGPFMLYVPTNYDATLDGDFKSNSDKTIRQRIREVDQIIDVKVADKLTDDNVILVQMTSDVVRMVEGLNVTTVEWQSEGGMIFHFKVMAIMIPQIRADQDDRSGLIHGS